MSGKCEVLCQTDVDIGRYCIKWRIGNYRYFLLKKGEAIDSPTFKTGKNQVEWALRMYPEGTSGVKDGYISCSLFLKSQVKITVFVSISVLYNSKKKGIPVKTKRQFTDSSGWGFPDIIEKNNLFNEEDGLLKNDTLELNVDMEVVENINYFSTTSSLIGTDMNIISEDYLNLLNTSNMSDFTITVKNRQFNVHKVILSARCPVFAAMFTHDLKEAETNVLEIEDVNPDVMECVIQYIYSGKCHKLEEMAEEILPVSDKYGLEHLKLMCEETLCYQLKLDNIISILCLADKHSAHKLKEKSIDYICDNYRNIREISEWKTMASKNKDLVLEIWSVLIDKHIIKQISLVT